MDAETHLQKTADLKKWLEDGNAKLTEKAVNIKGKDYVLVKDRILFFNETCDEGSITTELVSAPDAPMVVIKATVSPDGKRFFTGYSQATWAEFGINKTSALENAETSAVGRALAFMGIGVIESIASADEMHKALGPSKGDKTAKQVEDEFLDPEHHLPDRRRTSLIDEISIKGHSQ